MNERIKQLAKQVPNWNCNGVYLGPYEKSLEKFAELIIEDMHKKVIASILITDVVMEEKGKVPTSEDYIQAINKDFGVK
jgi:hypothetical protein